MDKIVYLVLLVLLALLYFRIAKHYNIVDKPNHRSSHNEVTIRGGGILFLIAGLAVPILSGEAEVPYWAGLLIIGLISFWDDLKNLPGKIRFVAQGFSVALMIYALNLPFHVIVQIIIAIAVIGAINIYNFMDGINGITGLYSLVTLLSLGYINAYEKRFVPSDYIILPLLAILVFLFFNLRKKAVCFAGDVGSVSIAFIILYLTGKLIILTGDLKYAGFLLVYGLDGMSTIFFRIIRHENLSEAHRSHLYQYLANEQKWSHLVVSVLFATIQLLVNFVIVKWASLSGVCFLFAIVIGFLLTVGVRLFIQGPKQLLKQI